jgi:hypothetical protein
LDRDRLVIFGPDIFIEEAELVVVVSRLGMRLSLAMRNGLRHFFY